MIGTHDLPLFVVSALLLNITPGPDTLYIVGRSTQGFRAGAVAALFFLAFLPQFVGRGAESRVLAFLFLGLLFNINGTLWNLFVAWSAARVGRTLGTVCLGARLALAEK